MRTRGSGGRPAKRWYQQDYDESVTGKPSTLYDEEIPPEELPD